MKKVMLCTSCGSIVRPKSYTEGSFIIELCLWLLLLIPGLIYSFYRLSTRHKVCPLCGSSKLIPQDSPIALNILNSIEDDVEDGEDEEKEKEEEEDDLIKNRLLNKTIDASGLLI